MALPTKNEICEAVENPSSNVLAPQLAGYTPKVGLVGAESYFGGFGVVFPFEKGNDIKAVRAWHQEIDNIKQRYSLMSNDFKKAKLRFLCNLEYVSDGLKVGNSKLDLIIMDWVEGKQLKDYIKHQIETKSDADLEQVLDNLAQEIREMFIAFHKCGFSHGDLQHDNIIVDDNGHVKLIDYDCVYTPSMGSSFAPNTIGYSGYQHPKRNRAKVSNEKTDYFSELVLFLSIKALAKSPSLWKYSNDDYSLLLTINDFKNINSSALVKEILALGGEFHVLIDILKQYLSYSSIDSLRPFPELFAEMTTPPVIESFEAERRFSFPGVPVKLSWSVSGNFEEVYLSPPKHKVYLSPSKRKVSAKGEEFVEPNKDVRYKLEAVGLAGSVTKSLQIRMLPLPVIQSIKVPTPEMKSIANVSISMPRFPVEAISLPRFVATPSLKMETPKSIDVSRLSAAINKGIKSVKLNPPLPSFWQDLGNVLKRHTRRYTSLWTDLKNYLKRNNDGK